MADIERQLGRARTFQNGEIETEWSSYPRNFHNFEGLKLSSPGPWLEFPVIKNSFFEADGSPDPVQIIYSQGSTQYDVVYHDPTKWARKKQVNDRWVLLDFTEAVLYREADRTANS